MQLYNILSSLLLISTASASWQPAPPLEGGIEPLLIEKRASSFDLSPTNKEGNTATTVAPSITPSPPSPSPPGPSAPNTSGTPSNSNSNSKGKNSSNGSQTSQSSNSTSSTSSVSSYVTTHSYNDLLPAGGVQLLTPNTVTDPAQYYRINALVTFAWNYTSLKATPSAVNVLASCSANSATYTIAHNYKVSSNSTQAVTWDTDEYQATATVPLLTETYTLIIYDADKPETALPESGYLATYNQFTFGMYEAQPFNAIGAYLCATCNGASSLEGHTVRFVFGTAILTVLSFGWFVGVAGLW